MFPMALNWTSIGSLERVGGGEEHVPSKRSKCGRISPRNVESVGPPRRVLIVPDIFQLFPAMEIRTGSGYVVVRHVPQLG